MGSVDVAGHRRSGVTTSCRCQDGIMPTVSVARMFRSSMSDPEGMQSPPGSRTGTSCAFLWKGTAIDAIPNCTASPGRLPLSEFPEGCSTGRHLPHPTVMMCAMQRRISCAPPDRIQHPIRDESLEKSPAVVQSGQFAFNCSRSPVVLRQGPRSHSPRPDASKPAASGAKYVRIPSHPARLNAVNDSRTALS